VVKNLFLRDDFESDVVADMQSVAAGGLELWDRDTKLACAGFDGLRV
jgi:hypothetical protein